MAFAALVSLSQIIDQILNHSQYSISPDEKQKIRSIHDNVAFLQLFLESFPEKANNFEGRRIRNAANNAEDIIECFMLEDIQPKVELERHLIEVEEEIGCIACAIRDITELGSSRRTEGVPLGDHFAAASSSSSGLVLPPDKNVMVGPNGDLLAIKDRLCGEPSKLQVIPIVGMGGIGKTTIARNAYDDPLIVQHFDIRAWVTISQDYNAQEILAILVSSLLDATKESKQEKSDLVSSLLDAIKESNEEKFDQSNGLDAVKVYKSLKSRRYLIVMDDVWSTDALDDIRMMIPDDNNGSRIILTTRLAYVAAYPDPCSPLHEMHFMDADESWNLLRYTVFQHQHCPHELENLGKMIARSCGGLPLAIVVIGGLLSMVSKASWGEIAGNVNSLVATTDERFERILSLSYNNLPHHLRQCFLYMGGFPEDYKICVSKLVNLWIAEGFVIASTVSKSFEEEAEEYLEDLVRRRLVFVSVRKSNGRMKNCGLHDLLRDLCLRKAEEEKFRLYITDLDKIIQENIKNQLPMSVVASSLGSLGHDKPPRVLEVGTAIFNPFPFGPELYVSIPGEVFELSDLRYLDMAYFVEIPAAISSLVNLQTLIIHPIMEDLILLPSDIWKMPQLRHLVSLFGPLPDPKGATSAENLRTLSVSTNFICTERIVKMIPNLKKLGLLYFANEFDQDYHLDNLVLLHQLEKLKLQIHPDFRGDLNPTFPAALRKLTLSGGVFHWKDMGIVGLLPNLQVLKLRSYICKGDIWETAEGDFPELTFLLIEVSDLQHWITESSHFPKLKFLLLHYCWCLSEIPEGIGEIPTLELIEVTVENISLVESVKRIQKEQESYGNDTLQVRLLT